MNPNHPDVRRFLQELGYRTAVEDAPLQVKELLERELVRGLQLPGRFLRPREESYARHLLARFQSGATAIVMVWDQGQATPVHDHAGLWCVEGVVQGRIQVTRYHLRRGRGSIVRFEKGEVIHSGLGQAGALIPPVDHHTIANQSDEVAVTLHVYGGEMKECQIFLPETENRYRPMTKTLTYTSEVPLFEEVSERSD